MGPSIGFLGYEFYRLLLCAVHVDSVYLWWLVLLQASGILGIRILWFQLLRNSRIKQQIRSDILADKITWNNFKHALHGPKAGGQDARNKTPQK